MVEDYSITASTRTSYSVLKSEGVGRRTGWVGALEEDTLVEAQCALSSSRTARSRRTWESESEVRRQPAEDGIPG